MFGAVARTERTIDATPQRIFEVLADPDSYGHWVVGSKRIRDADQDFPAPGSRFHHAVGFGPIDVKDYTEVLEWDPPRRLKLRAKARPLGTALVTLEVSPLDGNRSQVTMIEDPGDPLTKFVFNPLTHLLVRGRNVESLERLEDLAKGDPDAEADAG